MSIMDSASAHCLSQLHHPVLRRLYDNLSDFDSIIYHCEEHLSMRSPLEDLDLSVL